MQPTPSLQEAAEAFAAWRSNRSGSNARTPDALRQMALTLTRHYPMHQLVKSLGMSSSSFAQWRREAAAGTVEPSTAFVPLTTQPAAAALLRQMTFDFDNGETLTLSGNLSQPRLFSLVQAVLQLPAQPGV